MSGDLWSLWWWWFVVGFGLGGLLATLWCARIVQHRLEHGQYTLNPKSGRLLEWPHWLNRRK